MWFWFVVWFYRLNIIPTLVSTSTSTLTRVWQQFHFLLPKSTYIHWCSIGRKVVLGREYLAQRVVIGPGSLRVPPVVADKAKLAIVFTYFFLFWPRRLACAMHSLAIVITIVQSFSLSPPSFAFDPLRESPVCENLFPPIFWHN